ncbi:MAG: gliding motility-associated C-terminal domain-containing protein [Saprospiraceae bacterium]|nr:gliding motility-associated C-terminal domain-containing protein [Saprospiraceae bacterium]
MQQHLFRYFLALTCGLFLVPHWAKAQSPVCTNPIDSFEIVVTNSSCNSMAGSIAVLMEEQGPFNYVWSPNLGTGNYIEHLPSGNYHLSIIRQQNPECQVDTTIIVTNDDGPDITIYPEVLPHCDDDNGVIISTTLAQSLTYVWNNGTVGPRNENLTAGTYTVTVTNALGTCTKVEWYTLQSINPLMVSSQVLYPAKCNMNTGQAEINVTGGSGNYAYSLGNGALLTGLGAGVNNLTVTDNESGCEIQTSFDIPSVTATGQINVVPHPVSCPGKTDGSVDITVIPGANFATPYTFSVVDISGFAFPQNALPVGQYRVLLFDKDSCRIESAWFGIDTPDPIVINSAVSPATCDAKGAIQLTFSGGTGPIQVNWNDLPAVSDPVNRFDLSPGYYTGIVYDSLLCSVNLDTFKILTLCNQSQYLHEILTTFETRNICIDAPAGVPYAQVNYSLIGGFNSGSSIYGSWNLGSNNCLTYTAKNKLGFAVDTICILRQVIDLNIKDTICYVFSITPNPPSQQDVYISTQPLTTITSCGVLPPNFSLQHIQVVQINDPGLTGTSGPYGSYSISPVTGCLTFISNSFIGDNVDNIVVAVYDTILHQCRIITYIPSILPEYDCATILALQPEYQGVTTICSQPGDVCIPIPFAMLTNFAVLDNGLPFTGAVQGCDFRMLSAYVLDMLPSGGPFLLKEWMVNGQPLSGNFIDINGLLQQMNQLDPGGNWMFQPPAFILGGMSSNTYGPLKIESVQGNVKSYDPSQQTVANASQFPFTTGQHEVIFRDLKYGCLDTTIITITCMDCPPLHNFQTLPNGTIHWETYNCNRDTMLITNLPFSDLPELSIMRSGLPFTQVVMANGGFIGLKVGIGTHDFTIKNVVSTCEYTLRMEVVCKPVEVALEDHLQIPLNETLRYCLDTTILGGYVTALTRVCTNNGNVSWMPLQNWCFDFTGEQIGQDTFCFQLCDDFNECLIIKVYIQVVQLPSDSLSAQNDIAFALKDGDVSINILSNDVIRGQTGNAGALTAFTIIQEPTMGTYTLNPATGQLIYTPDPERCGNDSLRYRITDDLGQVSEATVIINVACNKILIFNGVSPNNDGFNDRWKILGIEQYPNNEVYIFNRWGNQVFHEKGYTNADGWQGIWENRHLPDGTYFYMIDLGDGVSQFKGYIELVR